MRKRSHVNIGDIAEKLSVSSVTVSKALRGHPDISPETTARIKKIALELGYVPNLMARNLSARNSQTIGVIVPKIAHFFFSSVIEAIYDAAFENKYEILLTVSQENADREATHLQTLLSMRVDGLIVSVSQQTQSSAIFDAALKRGVPLTFMDRVMEIKGANKVTGDDHGGAFAATEQAIKVGYRKLGHIGGPEFTSIGKERFRGFKDALKQYDVPFNPAYHVPLGFSEEDGYKGFMRLHSTGNLPEFVFAVSFPVALGVMRAAKELGLVIPKDIDMICFGAGPLNQFISPKLSVVDQPTGTLGRAALEMTLENIRGGESFKPQGVQLPTKLLLGETCIARSGQMGS